MKYISDSVTFQNSRWADKPNEDYIICDDGNQLYILVDGVSRDKSGGIYPNPSPAREVSVLFANTVYDYLVSNHEHIMMQEAIRLGNQKIAEFNGKVKWENNFLPGTVGIVSMIENRKMYYCYIGDCYGLKICMNGKKVFFTECQTKQIAKHRKKYTAYEIRNQICNNKEHPDAYGVLNGDIRALDFVVQGEIEMQEDDRIILCSDGFDDLVTMYSALDLYNMPLEEMYGNSENKDDKTLVRISKYGEKKSE